jgi:hypothetical protein
MDTTNKLLRTKSIFKTKTPIMAARIVRSSAMESSFEPNTVVVLNFLAKNPSMASVKKLSGSSHLKSVSLPLKTKRINTGDTIRRYKVSALTK